MGLVHSWNGDFVFLGWIHDEVQIAARTPRWRTQSRGSALKKPPMPESSSTSGVPSRSEAKTGTTWAETH